MTYQQDLKDSLTDSKFNMWRACMAVVRLDGKVTTDEMDWVVEKLKLIPFSDAQRKILEEDFKVGTSASSLIEKITDKKDRAFLLHMIRVIGHLDNDFSDEEKQLFKTLNDAIMMKLDLKALEATIAQIELDSYREDVVFQNQSGTRLEQLFRTFQKLHNPGDYKFPEEEES